MIGAAAMSQPASAWEWLAEARRYEGMRAAEIGLSRTTLWCGAFMERVARRAGLWVPPAPHRARSWMQAGTRLRAPRAGAIVVFSRGANGGHVGIIEEVRRDGLLVISGNNRGRVRSRVYPLTNAIAYVWPRAAGVATIREVWDSPLAVLPEGRP